MLSIMNHKALMNLTILTNDKKFQMYFQHAILRPCFKLIIKNPKQNIFKNPLVTIMKYFKLT